MKILLIYPPFESKEVYSEFNKIDTVLPPLGLAYIASSLIQKGYDVQLIDSFALSLSLDDIKKIIVKEKPDLVGATANSPIYFYALKLMRIVKEISPAIKTILGGNHPTFFPEDVLSNECIDYVAIREGEITCVELSYALEEGNDLNQVAGLGFKKDGRIVINKERPFIQDLDSLPYPAYHLLPLHKYKISAGFSKYPNQVSIISSRGCPSNCYFCTSSGFWKRIVRFNSPTYMIGNINYLCEEFNIKSFQFRDDNFTTSKERVISFCRLALTNRNKFEWSCYSRFDFFDEEMLDLMKASGCYQISLGVESGSDNKLQQIKEISKSTIEKQMCLLKKKRLRTVLFFLVGPPAESAIEINETLDFAKQLEPDIFVANISIPFPGSRYYSDMRKKGNLPDFEHQATSIYKSPCDLPPFTKSQLDELITECYRSFYFRASYILRIAFSIRSFAEAKNLFFNSYSLFKFFCNSNKG